MFLSAPYEVWCGRMRYGSVRCGGVRFGPVRCDEVRALRGRNISQRTI